MDNKENDMVLLENCDLSGDDIGEFEESESVSQIHLVAGKILNEGPAFKAVRENDIPRLSAILFSGYDLNSSNENEASGDKDTFYEIQDRDRMVRVVRIKGYTPFHLAVVHSSIKVIKYLLSKGADVNVADANSISPLSLAAAVQRPDVTKLVISAGGAVDCQSISGRTPLLQAVGNNNESIVRQLLKAGADPNLADFKGTTPLLLCLQASRDQGANLVVMQALIDAGAIVDLPNKQGATALMVAIGTGRLDSADLLLKAGADINVRDNSGQGLMHMATGTTTALYLLHNGITSDWPDKKGVTPLLKAARVGHISLTTFLLEADSQRTPAILDLPRVVQARQQVPVFDQWLQAEFGSPRSLRRLCRQEVRRCLSPDNTPCIRRLPVPQMVQDFLLGKHMELMFHRPKPLHAASFVPTFHF